jgi:type II secretory pathway pseudopilin PulG
LLIVVAVIAILAGITLAALGGANQKSARDRAAAEVAALANAIERYKMQNDAYPAASGTNLVFTSIDMFMEANPSSVSGSQLLDPFGAPYRYRNPGTVNIATFDVWSDGASTTNTNDDIGNW